MDLSWSMGFSCEDVDIGGKTREAPPLVVEEGRVDVVLGGDLLYSSGSSAGSSCSSSSSSTRRNRIMDDDIITGELDSAKKKMEFWPLQHPMEPPSEDQPVKCPITHHNYYSSPPTPPITMPKEAEAAAAAAKEYYLRDSPRTSDHVDDDTEMKIKLINGDIAAAGADHQPHQTPRPLRKRHHAHSILSSTHSSYN